MAATDDSVKPEQAIEAGKEFSKLYYERFDKNRHSIQKLYLDTATLIWNGNMVSGLDSIVKFIEALPVTEHKLESLDCQPLTDQVSGGQFSIIVKTFGTVKYQNRKAKTFNQNFMLTSLNNVWKIVSDSFRLQEQ